MDLLATLLAKMIALGASDLFLSTGRTPAFRVHGKLSPYDGPILDNKTTHEMARHVMTDAQYRAFMDDPEINLSYDLEDVGRFRLNIFRQRREIGIVVRAIPNQAPGIDTLGIPGVLKDVVMLRRGLVLVVGPTGTGKSTTLAALIDYRNGRDAGHIVTIEDPIEYLLPHRRSVVNQREIGIDTNSYDRALHSALRQSPDVLMIGEIRARETMEHAVAYADTGHLCLATMHANNASQAFERIINLFPETKREQILLSLSLNIRAVVSQQLVPTLEGGRTAAFELLLSTPRVGDLIRRGEFAELQEAIEKGAALGMQTLDQSLYNLYQQNVISAETALEYANSYRNMRLRMRFASAAEPATMT